MQRSWLLAGCLAVSACTRLGAAGPQGERGPRGEPGPQGPQGEPGPMPVVASGGGLSGAGTPDAPLTVNTEVLDARYVPQAAQPVLALVGHATLKVRFRDAADGAADGVSLPWTPEEAHALVGKTFVWAGEPPELQDTTTCNAGSNPNVRVEAGPVTGVGGQYLVTVSTCDSSQRVCLMGSWSGWNLRLIRSTLITDLTTHWSDQTAHDTDVGRVEFMLAADAGTWRLEHMRGTIGNDAFSCY